MPTISHWRCGRRAALDLGGRPQGRCAIARMRAEGFAPAAVVETIRRRQEGSRTGIVWIGFPPAYLSMLPAPGLGVRFELGNAGQDDGRPARGQGIQLPETSFRPWLQRSCAEWKSSGRRVFRAWKRRPARCRVPWPCVTCVSLRARRSSCKVISFGQ